MRAAASRSWGTSPISADWFARCSPTRVGRSWSSAKARPACSSSPARWGGARPRSIGFSVRNTSGCSAPRMTRRPENLLAAPAPGAARRIALSLLDAATAARERLPDASDAEALHDFRVAMRRLRSTLRAYQPQLEAVVPAKLRRRLRDLARATGEARDVEVQISWLERQRNELPGARRAGVPWLLSRLTQRRERAYQDIRERIAPKFERLARRLRRALGSVPPPDATLPASLASLIAQLLEDQGSDLERLLALIRSPANHAEAHAARPLPAKLTALAAELRPPAPIVAAAPAARPHLPLPARYTHRARA